MAPVARDPRGLSGPTPGQARGSNWRRTGRGLFVPSSVDASPVEQRILEQAANLPGGGAVTGWAALRLAGGGFFDGLDSDGRTPLPVPLAVPPGFRLRPNRLFQLMRTQVPTAEITPLHGIPATILERAVFDEVRRLDELREAVVVIDMALVARLISVASLDAFTACHPRLPGIALLRRARHLATTRSRSPAETRLRLIWRLDAGLPAPLCNWPVSDAEGNFIGSPDLISPQLAVYAEFDGAGHRNRAQHRIDVRRDDLFRRTGLEGIGVVGNDLQDRQLVVGRLLAGVDRAATSKAPRTWLLKRDPRPLWP